MFAPNSNLAMVDPRLYEDRGVVYQPNAAGTGGKKAPPPTKETQSYSTQGQPNSGGPSTDDYGNTIPQDDMYETIPQGDVPGGLGYGQYYQQYGQYQNYNNSTNLPNVDDPDDAYAQITRDEYLDYVRNYRGFEEQLIQQALSDTSLIDQAREDVEVAQGLAAGISERNAARYGASLTPAQRQQQSLRLQRANTLGGIQSVNDARIAQREANTALLSDLINIGQGVNRASQNQLGSAAADATQRQNAYQAARAQSRAQTYSTIGSLGAMAIMAFAF